EREEESPDAGPAAVHPAGVLGRTELVRGDGPTDVVEPLARLVPSDWFGEDRPSRVLAAGGVEVVGERLVARRDAEGVREELHHARARVEERALQVVVGPVADHRAEILQAPLDRVVETVPGEDLVAR